MATKSYWFPHDTTAFNDMKIESMTSVYGSEGYGFYWIIVETLSMEEGYKLSLQKKSVYGVLSRRTQSTPEQIKEFVEDCINDFELFQSDEEYFWSDSLQRRLKKRDDKSQKARELVNRRWNKQKSNADSPQKDTESRSSDKNSLKENLEEFDKFWFVYDKKVGKDKSYALWNKLSKKDREDCMKFVPLYIKERTNKQYRKNPETFLRNKSWNDEIITSNNAPQEQYNNVSNDEFKKAFGA
jgi:GH24 family phage-related lysozyme (muramidase)